MINIMLKFVAQELTPGFTNGEITIESGMAIRELISYYADKNSLSVPSENQYKLMYPLFNGKPAGLDSVLEKDGTLHICRVSIGGC